MSSDPVTVADLQGGGLRDVRAELRVELGKIVREYGCFMAGPRDRDVAEASAARGFVETGVP